MNRHSIERYAGIDETYAKVPQEYHPDVYQKIDTVFGEIRSKD